MTDFIQGEGNAVVKFVEVLRSKGATRVEFGYEPRPDGSEPAPGEATTWYAEADIGGVTHRGEHRSSDHARSVLLAFEDCATRAGLRVRMSIIGGAN